MRILGYIAAVAFLLAAFAAGCNDRPPKGEPVTASDGVVRIDASGIPPGETRFYRYESPRGDISVFLLARTDSGELKAAFDACITCYPHEKGYRPEEDCVVCVYCDTKFTLDELGTGRGNCIPVALEFEEDGDYVVIRETDLAGGSMYFPGQQKR